MRPLLPLLLLSFSAVSIAAAASHAVWRVPPPSGAGENSEFHATVISHEGFTAEQEVFMRRSVAQLERILASPAFRDSVLLFRQPNGTPTFLDNLDLTNAEVYERIMRASEVVGQAEDDHEADLNLRLRTASIGTQLFSSTIGYNNTYLGEQAIYTYRHKFKKLGQEGYTGHLAHEWMHSLGFDDNPNKKIRDSSVPYAIGYIVESLAEAEAAP